MIAVFASEYQEYIMWLRSHVPYPISGKIEPGKPYFMWGGNGKDTDKLLSYERGIPFIILPGCHTTSEENQDNIRNLIKDKLMIQVELTDLKNAF